MTMKKALLLTLAVLAAAGCKTQLIELNEYQIPASIERSFSSGDNSYAVTEDLNSIKFAFKEEITPYPSGAKKHKLAGKDLQAEIDRCAAENETLVIPAGTFTAGHLVIPSNSVIYLERDAVIQRDPSFKGDHLAFITIAGDNVQILGNGCIDGNRRAGSDRQRYLVMADECNGLDIDGPLFIDSEFWAVRIYRCNEVEIKNIKIVNDRPEKNWNNTDGVDFDSSADCSLTDSFLYCGDDCMVVKGLDDSPTGRTSNIRFSDNTVFCNSAAAKIGTETCVKVISDVVFEHIDILQCMRAMVIDAYDSSYVKSVRFEDFKIAKFAEEGKESGRLMDFEITDRSWRRCTGECIVEDVTVKDIALAEGAEAPSMIHGHNDEFYFKDVKISNITPEDQRIHYNEYVK